MRGRDIEPGIKRLRMRQSLHTFRVNRNFQDTCPMYVASGTSERDQLLNNGGLRYRSLFVVLGYPAQTITSSQQVIFCKYVISHRSEGMNTVISNACAYV